MRIEKLLLVCLAAALVFGAPAAHAQDDSPQGQEQEQKEKKKTEDQDDLDALRRAAEAEAKKEKDTEEEAEETTFKSGNLGLQALNPEFSVTGDMLGTYQSGIDDLPTTETAFRGLGLHLEAYLDPYSKFKAAVPISLEGAELGEAYFTRFGAFFRINLTLGKFRQQFGVVNRWHKHALDWFDFPLALRSVFGPGGLNQIGLSLDYSGATGRLVHGFWVEVTDATNPQMFGQNSDNRPSILGRYMAYTDLSASTYLQLGFTGLVGWNNAWTIVDTSLNDSENGAESSFNDSRNAVVYGADLVLMWEPTDRMRYRNIEWRSEGYFVDKGIQAPDGSGSDRLQPWGFYSMIQAKMSRTIEVGVRYDYFAPDTKDYASVSDPLSLAPLAVTTSDAYRQLIGGWLTWWQSPFVKFRGGYSYENGTGTGPNTHYVMLQMVFAAGPHKHERY